MAAKESKSSRDNKTSDEPPYEQTSGQPPDEPGSGEPSYEHAREELAEVVARLEAGGTTLEESLALWERGEALAKICQRWLDGARERLAAATGRANPDDR